jgi:hypothetical protein
MRSFVDELQKDKEKDVINFRKILPDGTYSHTIFMVTDTKELN